MCKSITPTYAGKVYTIKPVRHHNRQLHKATILKGSIRKNNQAPKYVFGFRLFDKVLYNGIECFVWADEPPVRSFCEGWMVPRSRMV